VSHVEAGSGPIPAVMMHEWVAWPRSESLPLCHGFNTGPALIAASACAPKDGPEPPTATKARQGLRVEPWGSAVGPAETEFRETCR
jgi:hypothetical protein